LKKIRNRETPEVQKGVSIYSPQVNGRGPKRDTEKGGKTPQWAGQKSKDQGWRGAKKGRGKKRLLAETKAQARGRSSAKRNQKPRGGPGLQKGEKISIQGNFETPKKKLEATGEKAEKPTPRRA